MSNWASLRVVDLKAELKKRDLPQHGLKSELVARLEESDAASGESKAEPATGEGKTEAAIHDEQATQPEALPTDEATPTIAKPEPPQPETQASDAEIADALPDAPQSDNPTEPQDKDAEIQDAPTVSAPAITPTEPALTAQEAAEAQGRKRRSKSPPISEEQIALKKARADLPSEDANVAASPDQTQPAHSSATNVQDEMDWDHPVAPSRYPVTESLYISNLMRPLRPDDMKAHLATLAAADGQEPDESVIRDFFIDQIRTHALVTFASIAAASRVRALLHDRVWPEESNRKSLWVDYIPTDKVSEWIDTQERRAGGGRSTTRWQILYEDDTDGTVRAVLTTNDAQNARSGPPPGPAAFSATNDPYRGRDMGLHRQAPPDFRDAGRDRSPSPAGESKMTLAYPQIAFQPVSEKLASRRLRNMRSFYTKDADRYYGREINRYSFEDGHSFVDRGKEFFEGIRPPHRQRGGRGGRGRGDFRRGGPPPFRAGNDRYGSSYGGRDDRGRGYGQRSDGSRSWGQRRDNRDMRY